ncbi:MAG: hypothetical protein WC284_05850 [Candidimonas sp.]|jgi:hypothetical protein
MRLFLICAAAVMRAMCQEPEGGEWLRRNAELFCFKLAEVVFSAVSRRFSSGFALRTFGLGHDFRDVGGFYINKHLNCL